MKSANQDTTRTLSTVRQFSEKHPAFSQGSLRNLIFKAFPGKSTAKIKIEPNGLAVAIVRLGRKILIDEVKFFEWLESQQ